MAAAHLTLEEAADRLNLTPEEFKRRLKTDKAFKELDAAKIRDGSTFRFKSVAVDELARQLGVDSSPELPLSPLDEPPSLDSEDFKLSSLVNEEPRKPAEKKAADEPLLFSSEDDDIFSLAADEPKADPKKPAKSDSDARLEGDKPRKGKKDEAIVPTEEIAIDFGGPGSAVIKGGSSAKLSAPKSSSKLSASDSGKGLANPGVGDSSEFELSLDADSDDFELKLNADASDDEVELGGLPRDPSGSSSGKRGAESGILNRTPADSGISLEKSGGKSGRIKGDKDKPKSDRIRGEKPKPASTEDSDSDVDFELTLDSSAAASASKLGGMKDVDSLGSDSSDSEFELTLDDGASSLEHAALGESGDGDSDLVVEEPEADKGDIFETDFEIPPMDESGSEAVALESSDTDLEKSDFDIADSDAVEEDTSGSEVVLLEDDEEAPAPRPKGKAGKKAAAAEEDEGGVDLADVEPVEVDEDDGSAASALKGAKGGADDEEEEEEAVGAGADYRPAPWGIIPALLLLPTAAVTLIGAVMAFQLLQTMSGYQQPSKPAAPLVRDLAKSLEMPLNDQ